jgi:hypothetical protein
MIQKNGRAHCKTNEGCAAFIIEFTISGYIMKVDGKGLSSE